MIHVRTELQNQFANKGVLSLWENILLGTPKAMLGMAHEFCFRSSMHIQSFSVKDTQYHA